MKHKYQLFGRLRSEEYAALEADILKRGIKVPIELDENGDVLDGHNRKEIGDRHGLSYKTITRKFKTEQDKREHVIKLNLARRHLEPYQWGRAFKMLLEERGVRRGSGKGDPHAKEHKADTVSALATEVGVDDRTARRRTKAADDYDSFSKVEQQAVDDRKKTIPQVKRERKKRRKQREDAEASQKAAAVIEKNSANGVYHGDSFELAVEIPDASCAMIFTDPPYDRKSLPLFGKLGTLANRILVEGGSLITYCGQYILPEVIEAVAPAGGQLRFFWINCCLHTGGVAQMREYGIKVKWKPLLWFVKGDFRRDRETWVDDLVESIEEKSDHPWQQSVVEATYYIERLTTRGEVVVDPFCGAGTTAVAAKQLGRAWWTADTNAKHVKTARDRLDDANI